MENLCEKTALTEKIKRVLISEEEIREKVAEAGSYISEKYADKPLLVVGILKGSFVFMSDLVRQIKIPCEVAFMAASSYCGTNSTGNVQINLDIKQDISNYHLVIAEDIIDSGRTLYEIIKLLKLRKPLSVEVVAFMDKPSRRVADFTPDYTLFTVPDYFVVGYGLDYNEKYRNLPYVAEYGEDA